MPTVRPGPRKRARREPTPSPPAGTWQGCSRLWIEIDGRNALGPGKMRLLEAIAATKSLSAAARQLGMSYRLAWKHLKLLEERLGLPVVEPHRGGTEGGGSILTPDGRALLDAYARFHAEVDEFVAAATARHFGRWAQRPRPSPPRS